jgi:hypothetical protein
LLKKKTELPVSDFSDDFRAFSLSILRNLKNCSMYMYISGDTKLNVRTVDSGLNGLELAS